MKTDGQTDENFCELADAIAAKILYDHRGLEIHGDGYLLMTEQLGKRIARCLRAFHHREGHLEDYDSGPCPHEWKDAAATILKSGRFCLRCGTVEGVGG